MPFSELQDIAGKTEAQNSQRVFSDRPRTNILRPVEQPFILFLLQRVPQSISPNMLTFLGALGSVVVLLSFAAAAFSDTIFLLAGIPGLFINWLGDSLDGRLAYYRNTPRKWYGFVLDIIMDWFSIVLIGFGYYIYASSGFKWLGFLFSALYAWSMLIALLRYKITGRYQIDSGVVGPTELRVIIAVIISTEVTIPGLIHYAALLISSVLFAINWMDTLNLLRTGDQKDKEEKG